ncbi:CapA family protein [Tissierella pigra]|uniref:CapA family protein n=1 Tax=Tissierella pigra TaxID=2607614 RepID=A0A6N7XUP8_9FIRM|nr:CapA family protein [Tissierella pigra]MBU5425755.1 CapA family protein [Tissierella pigra]MSU01507.1 CapA family protein [Tissierella pigra]
MKKLMIIFVLVASLSIGILGFTVYKEILVFKNNDYVEVNKDSVYEDLKVEEDETIESTEEKVSTVKLLTVGDIMFHSPQNKAAYNPETKTYDFNQSFKYIKKYTENADIALGNFETVTREDVSYSGFPRFNTPKESLLALKEAGFDILSTANNHCLDQGKKGLVDTINNIHEYGMKNIGTYIETNNMLVEEVEGIRIGFLSYTYGLNGMDGMLSKEELDYMVNRIDEDRIKQDIENIKDLQTDIIVVSIHWGNEYEMEPSSYQMELGEKMVDWGANIILGSHPHVIQKSQIINKNGKDNFIIYSLGNFISNQRKSTMDNSYTEDGVMVQLEIEKNFSKGETEIKNIDYIPTWVHKYRKDNRLFYEVLPISDYLNGELEVSNKEDIKIRLEKSQKDTMSKMIEN